MEKLLRFVAYVATVLVILGFAAFAADELQSQSKRAQDELSGVTAVEPTAKQERAREKSHTMAREWIDDSNDVLLAPFAWAGDGAHNRWVHRGVPTILALLFYGFGLGMVARYSHGSPHQHKLRPTSA
jgi:hypothetical protein